MHRRRRRRRRRRGRGLLIIALGLVLAYAALATARHTHDASLRRASRSGLAWPAQGQAAFVTDDGRPAASPGQQPVPIASLAKVMTALLTLERFPLRDGEDGFTLTVTPDQAEATARERTENESGVAVEPGERLTERQLLQGLLIPSGNNIAWMLADQVAGSGSRFIDAMNAEARRLGMDRTVYTDPSGFDPGTVSTAADQLRVFRTAMAVPTFRRIVSMAEVTLPVAGTLSNFDPLISAGYFGKTGSDSAAGGCLAFFTPVTMRGRRATAIGVVLGQGVGNDTSALLAAAGAAAQQLVASATSQPQGGGLPRGLPPQS